MLPGKEIRFTSNFKDGSIRELALCILIEIVQPSSHTTSTVLSDPGLNPI